MVKVEDMIFTRTEEGTLIAQEVELESIEGKPKVKLRPLTRGKLQEIYAQAQSVDAAEKAKADSMIIKEGLVEPVMTEEQIADMKPNWAGALSVAILSVSLGISQEDVGNQAQEVIANQEIELKKK